MQIAQQNQCLQVFFKLLKAFQEDHVFGGLNRPTTGTTSYKVYIASCPPKSQPTWVIFIGPQLSLRRAAQSAIGTFDTAILNRCHLLL